MAGRVPDEVRTERLLLRRWRPEDAEPLAEIYAQPEFLEHMPPRDLDQTREQIARLERSWEENGYSQWAGVDLESGRLVGRLGMLCHHDWPLADGPVPEVGWVLHRDFWGRGLATEAGRVSIECWRGHLDDPRLISITLRANRRSWAVMERLGMTYGGTARWHGYDVIWYALDR
jgi:RimJ/RimL family protein N-acetyltransferase